MTQWQSHSQWKLFSWYQICHPSLLAHHFICFHSESDYVFWTFQHHALYTPLMWNKPHDILNSDVEQAIYVLNSQSGKFFFLAFLRDHLPPDRVIRHTFAPNYCSLGIWKVQKLLTIGQFGGQRITKRNTIGTFHLILVCCCYSRSQEVASTHKITGTRSGFNTQRYVLPSLPSREITCVLLVMQYVSYSKGLVLEME